MRPDQIERLITLERDYIKNREPLIKAKIKILSVTPIKITVFEDGKSSTEYQFSERTKEAIDSIDESITAITEAFRQNVESIT